MATIFGGNERRPFVLEPERDIRNVPGAPGFFELRTPRPEQAAQFLGALFGWQFAAIQIAGAPYLEITLLGHGIGGVRQPAPGEPASPHTVTYVTIEDATATAARAIAVGGAVVAPPMPLGEEGRLTVVSHPDTGQIFAFEYNRPFS